MTTRKKAPPEEDEISITPKQLKWIIGLVAGFFGALVLWWQVWDRIDNRWRLESIQKANDAKVAAEINAVDKKAADALGDHLKADNRARSWTLFAIQDFRASAETRWAEECADRKRPPDVCRELDRRAATSRQQAQELRSKAMEASKEAP
jgi:hypothetical protein